MQAVIILGKRKIVGKQLRVSYLDTKTKNKPGCTWNSLREQIKQRLPASFSSPCWPTEEPPAVQFVQCPSVNGESQGDKGPFVAFRPVRGGMWEAFLNLGLEGVEPLGISLRKKKRWKIITSREKLVINGRKVILKSGLLQNCSCCIDVLLSGPPSWCAIQTSLYHGCVL